MATRLLEDCAKNDRARFICLVEESECLLRFRHLAHIWVKLPVTTLDHLTNPKASADRWLEAANAMKPALAELASTRRDRVLSARDVALLPRQCKGLDPFRKWLRKDQQVQRRVANAWNSLVWENWDRASSGTSVVPLMGSSTMSSDDLWMYCVQESYPD